MTATGAGFAFDPDLQAAVPGLPDLRLDDLAAARTALAGTTRAAAGRLAPRASRVEVEDREVPGVPGDPPVPVRVYRPRGDGGGKRGTARDRPAVLWFHGGGFVLGDLETGHADALLLADDAGCVVVNVDYRLAPEHPFPAAVHDCYAALVWAAGEAAELGVDHSRLAVGGVSAGGCLAAAVALLARDRGGPALALQILQVPILDDRLETPSMRAFTDTPLWNRPTAELSWRYYLGERPAEVTPYAAPARAADLAGLPAAYVMTAQYDPLRDEGIDYARRLVQAGVPTELRQYPGTFHAFRLVAAAVSRRATAEFCDAVRRRLAA